MSYLYEIECHCLIGGSADVESVGGIDAILTADPATLRATVETSENEIITIANVIRSHDVIIETSSDIDEHLSLEASFVQLIEGVGGIDDGLTVDYSVSQSVESISEIETVLVDKFHGDFPDYFDLLDYSNSQKLYPSGDLLFSDFIASDGSQTNLYSYIEEGLFIGKYTTHGAYSELIADDLGGYIEPETSRSDGQFTYKAYLDAFTVKPVDSRLLIRLSASLNNEEYEYPIRYTIKDIKFEDPDGRLIIQYEDLIFFGDASHVDGNDKEKNFTTFSLKPQRNVVAEKYQWQNGYPDLQQKNGYTITFTVMGEAADDAFTDGFTQGFIDGENLQNTTTLRISTIEVWNSGLPGIGPSPESLLNLTIMPPEKGKRLERRINPVFIPKQGFDTDIFPTSGNLLWTDHNGQYSNIDTCDNSKLISYITDGNPSTYITTHDVVNDSGKLILKFSSGKSNVNEITQGAFNFAFDKLYTDIENCPDGGAYDTQRRNSLNQSDNIFYGIDSISLSVTAKKLPNARDYFLDIVGYSDDCLLNVTSAIDGFLQNPSGADYYTAPISSGFANIDDLGIDGEAISDKSAYYETQVSGDHYELTRCPLVNSEEFQTYTIPLKIFDEVVELGDYKDYSWSNYLENLYLDIFPLPSGAAISDIHLLVKYKPQNAMNVSILGGDIGKAKAGRSEGAFFPTAMGSGDDYLNTGSGFQPMSRLEDVPHQFRSPETLKTNYARRWRGIKGLTYGPFNVNQFGFGFENPQLDSPLIDCLIDFSIQDGSRFFSRDFGLVPPTSVDYAKLGVGTTSPELLRNVGLRFTDGTFYENLLPGYSGSYKTADWTSLSSGTSNFQNHELYGKIFDGFDNAIRMNSGDNLQFSNVDPSSGISLYTRFIPDVNASGETYNFYNMSNLLYTKGSPSEVGLQVGFSNGYLSASGASEVIYDTIPYSGYQYPLSVLVTYNEKDDNKIRLYTDSELHKGGFTNLRATSNPVSIQPYSELVFGCSESLGIPMLLCEIGFSLPFNGSGTHIVESNPDRNLKQISASEFFDNQRMKFFDPEESYENDTFKLWDYVNEDSYHDWDIGAFRNPMFSPAFSTLTKRTNRDLISFYLEHDGISYANRVDLDFPENIDSGVSYHSQVENDFIRFHLTDSADNFYAIHPRVRKNLPNGYKFTDKALVVDTILQHQMSGDISWDRCNVGPKLIVSLYTKNQDTYWQAENYGLINRSIHYIEPSPSSIIKIESTFNHKDLCDESEQWAFFPDEQKVKDFGERLFSDDIDDMFLQYDIVYPSSNGFMSKLQVHTAHVRAENALVNPTQNTNNFDLITSGAYVENNSLDLYTFGVYGYASGDPIFELYTSGELAAPHSGGLDLFTSGALKVVEPLDLFTVSSAYNSGELNLFTSGELPEVVSGVLDFFVHGKNIITSEISDGQGGTIFGLPMTVLNGQTPNEITNTLDLSLFTQQSQDFNAIRSSTFDLMVFNDHAGVLGQGGQANSGILPLSTIGTDELASLFRANWSPLYINGSQTLTSARDIPLFIQGPQPEDGFANNSLDLFVYNIHGVGGTSFNWDSYDVGVGIDARDNRYSRLSLDNEIRGVNTVGYGACDNE